MGLLGAMKIQAQIKLNKQLNNYDGVLVQLKAKEEIELVDQENTTKKEKIEKEDEKTSTRKEKVEKDENIKAEVPIANISTEFSKNDNEEKIENEGKKNQVGFLNKHFCFKGSRNDKSKARLYELGFLLTKVIKKIFVCLSERQQIGEKLSSNDFISLSLTSGLFFLISVSQELMTISSDLGLYSLLLKTGFFWSHGIFLLLLKVRTQKITH